MTDTRKEQEVTKLKVTIDGVAVEADPGELIIDAAERAGIFIPRFCYHPQMEPVGMCRMCLVEVSGPRGFSLQPSCFVHVADGQEVLTASEKARKAQEGVIEFLLVNHPLDCPVCDKGGECPLQDQALSHGPGESRFLEEKRHWAKPIELSPLVKLDRERCIQCARCTRFADEVAGEALIDFAFRGSEVEVATFPDRPFSSYFSGNTVQICPVGALTATPYRFRSRPWDLEQVESTCTNCAFGCRIVSQSSAGKLVRRLGVDDALVNESWLCDRGRFGYEAVHASDRLDAPAARVGEGLVEVSWNEALGRVADAVREVSPEQVAVIGGARLSNEDAYAWAKLAKGVIGTDSVDAQLGDGLPAELVLGLPRASIADALSARVLISMTGDVREELPVLYLRLRDATTHGLTLIECSSVPTAASELATEHLTYLPGELARLAAALVGGGSPETTGVDAEALERARAVLGDGSDVVVLLGRANLAESDEVVASAAAVVHEALPGARFLSGLRRANVHGALDMGLAPGVLPGRVALGDGSEALANRWARQPGERGRSARETLTAAAAGEVAVLFLLGADPIADFVDAELAERALRGTRLIVAVGTHPDASNARADIVLPVAGEEERAGTTTNIEGRVSRLAPKVVPPGTAWPAWTVAVELADRLGEDLGLASVEEITDEIALVAPSHRGLDARAVRQTNARDGIIVPLGAAPVALTPRKIDPIATPGISSTERQGAPLRAGHAAAPTAEEDEVAAAVDTSPIVPTPALVLASAGEPVGAHRLDSYSYRLVIARTLYDEGALVAASPSLAPLAPAPVVRAHPAELARLGVAEGGSLRIQSPRGSLVATAAADAALSRQVVVVAHRIGELGTVLIEAGAPGCDVHLESLS